MDKDSERKEITAKKEEKWATEEERLCAKHKALNAIFIAVDLNKFKLIATCECARDAWNILKTAYEGTNAVKVSKLQIFSTEFEDLKMEKDETINEFNTKLCDIANVAFSLGENYSDTKLIRKKLRSIPRRFDIKFAAIEEAKDIDEILMDELMGSLLTLKI
ncbi:uncharacterized protein [Henckelia pumila]|uniref:uncharacterized protein n=1 Tax=Henckelia pumila TaxID=405737 RepID=UPI003C6E2C16